MTDVEQPGGETSAERQELRLPLPADLLPEKTRRFAAPDAPKPAKLMAARGMVPVRSGDLITLLSQLCVDTEAEVAEAARASLEKLPNEVVLSALQTDVHPAVLHEVARQFKRTDVQELIVQHDSTYDSTIELLARSAGDSLGELIATNQVRLLKAPRIIEALYMNKNVRMSTADRLVELCARNGVELDVPTFADHVQAIQGQLIIEATDEPLPTDVMFSEAVSEEHDEEAFVIDKVDKTEEVKDKFKPLYMLIRDMSQAEKLRLAMTGDAAARSLLVKDPILRVALAAVKAPKMTEKEAAAIAVSREVATDVLREIGNRREWRRSYELKKNLAFNPKTPVGLALEFISHLRTHDLKLLSRSRGISSPVRSAATQRYVKKQGKSGA